MALEESKGKEAEERIKAKYYGKAKVAAFVVAGAVRALPVAEAAVEVPAQFSIGETLSGIGSVGLPSLPNIGFPKFGSTEGGSSLSFSFLNRLKPPSFSWFSPPSVNLPVIPETVAEAARTSLENECVQEAISAGAEFAASAIIDKGVDIMRKPLEDLMEEKATDLKTEVRSRLDCCLTRVAVGECIQDTETVIRYRTRGCRASYLGCINCVKGSIGQAVINTSRSVKNYFCSG
jgi:hypothetical protein